LDRIWLRLSVEPMLCESVTKLLRVLASSLNLLRRPLLLDLNTPMMDPRLLPTFSRSVNMSAGRSRVEPAGTGGSGGSKWVVLASDVLELLVLELSLRLRTKERLGLGTLDTFGSLFLLLDDDAEVMERESRGSSGTSISPMVSMRSSSEPKLSSSSRPNDVDSTPLRRALMRLLEGMVYAAGC
jgi:hypothetical protein